MHILETPQPILTPMPALKPKKPTQRKKKLYWKAIDSSKIGEDSIWFDNESNDITLDEKV